MEKDFDAELNKLVAVYKEAVKKELIDKIENAFNGEELLYGDWLTIKASWEN